MRYGSRGSAKEACNASSVREAWGCRHARSNWAATRSPLPMTQKPRTRVPSLKLVGTDGNDGACGADQAEPIIRDVDWSILMARAQDGDGAPYHRLLQDVVPYLRSLAPRRHRDPSAL